MSVNNPLIGTGLGLRFPYFDDILKTKPQLDWIEVIAEDFLMPGPHHFKLMKLRELYPIVFHCVGLNVGGIDDFNYNHLFQYKSLFEKFCPLNISDHLCWSMIDNIYHHDLLPIPKTKKALLNTCERINILQDYFQTTLVLENVTEYIQFKVDEYSTFDFLKETTLRTGHKILLDITNLKINSFNHKLSIHKMTSNIPINEVQYVHFSGGEIEDDLYIDTHSSKVNHEDLITYKNIFKNKKIPVLLERDSNLPAYQEMIGEYQTLKGFIREL